MNYFASVFGDFCASGHKTQTEVTKSLVTDQKKIKNGHKVKTWTDSNIKFYFVFHPVYWITVVGYCKYGLGTLNMLSPPKRCHITPLPPHKGTFYCPNGGCCCGEVQLN